VTGLDVRVKRCAEDQIPFHEFLYDDVRVGCENDFGVELRRDGGSFLECDREAEIFG
jgi:hypothetical protein